MSITLSVTDGDFTKDVLNKLEIKSGQPLVSQHVFEVLQNASGNVSDAIDVREEFIDFMEGLLGLRLRYWLEKLQTDLRNILVVRTRDELIREIQTVQVIRDKQDKRTLNFWVRVLTEATSTVSVNGGI